MKNLALIAFLGCSLFVLPTTSHGQSVGAKEGDIIEAEWSGTWKTNITELRLEQHQDRVIGKSVSGMGANVLTVEGRVDGNSLTGEYVWSASQHDNSESHGTFKWELDTSDKFTGTWTQVRWLDPATGEWHQPEDPKFGGSWHGDRAVIQESDPYADEVISYVEGVPSSSEGPSHSSYALGAPDYIDLPHPQNLVAPTTNDTGPLATLGCGGQLVLRFVDNDLVNGDGADLRIYESGTDESFSVEISANGTNWIDLGKAGGGTVDFDITKRIKDNQLYNFVRITDLKSICGGTRPGVDIDAVEALNSTRNRRGPDLTGVEIIKSDTLDPIDEIAIGQSFRVRLTFAEDPGAEISENVTIRTSDGTAQRVRVTGNTRVIVSDPILVVPSGQ